MARPKLLFVVESGTDVRLVEGLAERFDLTILARAIPGGVVISQSPRCAVDVTVGSASRLRFARSVHRWLTQTKDAVDRVLVQGYALAALAANLATRRTGSKTVMLVCSPVERYYRCRRSHPQADKPFRWHELQTLNWLARLNARIGQRYVVLSDHLAGVVRDHGARGSVDVIPVYGVDTSVFHPASDPKRLIRQRLGLPERGALVFFSSRIAPEKDGDTLLAACAQLIAGGRDLRLLHRSGGFRDFVQYAQRFGIADRVIATDAIPPGELLASDYCASDLVVQASREEGLGFSPLEALACGTPVVAAAVGGLKETISNGTTGWTYPVGDIMALADCIADALDHPAEAERRAAAGRRMVTARFERRLVFDRLEALLA